MSNTDNSNSIPNFVKKEVINSHLKLENDQDVKKFVTNIDVNKTELNMPKGVKKPKKT